MCTNRPKLSYNWTDPNFLAQKHSGPLPQKVAQPNAQYTKKGPHIKLATSLGSWEANRGKGKEKKTEPLANNATKVQDDTEYECRTLTSKIQANNASLTAT